MMMLMTARREHKRHAHLNYDTGAKLWKHLHYYNVHLIHVQIQSTKWTLLWLCLPTQLFPYCSCCVRSQVGCWLAFSRRWKRGNLQIWFSRSFLIRNLYKTLRTYIFLQVYGRFFFVRDVNLRRNSEFFFRIYPWKSVSASIFNSCTVSLQNFVRFQWILDHFCSFEKV